MLLPITRVWHSADVILSGVAVTQKRTPLNIIRLIFALSGLAGNILIERNQLTKDVIRLGGVQWKRLD